MIDRKKRQKGLVARCGNGCSSRHTYVLVARDHSFMARLPTLRGASFVSMSLKGAQRYARVCRERYGGRGAC